jgi:hypothetical protein
MARSMSARTAAATDAAEPARQPPIGTIVTVALVAALLLVIAEFATVASITVDGESCEVLNDATPELADRCSLSGWERHGGALLLLALAAAGAGFAARAGAVGAAGAVLIAAGGVTLGLALIGDLPITNDTGAVGVDFDGASGSAGLGFYLELLGGALCLLAGALALMSGRRAAAAPASAS